MLLASILQNIGHGQSTAPIDLAICRASADIRVAHLQPNFEHRYYNGDKVSLR
jgi:hypothetical protein